MTRTELLQEIRVRAGLILSHPADRILSQGWKPTHEGWQWITLARSSFLWVLWGACSRGGKTRRA